jgi:prepilin-type N-terminal cleavage/methylation domain-containing protein
MKNGFTLIELLIALVISGLVLSAIYKIFISNNYIYLKQNELVKIEQNLRAAINTMSHEIRMAGYNSTDGIDSGVDYASDSTKIIFNYNNQTRYYYHDFDDKVIRDENSQKIATHIDDLTFEYNSTKSNCDEIDQVDITLKSFSDKNHLEIPTLNMTRTVYIRNSCLNE